MVFSAKRLRKHHRTTISDRKRQTQLQALWHCRSIDTDRLYEVQKRFFYVIHFESSNFSTHESWISSESSAVAKRRKVRLCSTHHLFESIHQSCIFIIIMVHLEFNILNYIDRVEDDSHGESRSSVNGSSRKFTRRACWRWRWTISTWTGRSQVRCTRYIYLIWAILI